MKTLNKTLSLVLVLVMVLGMFGVASAKEFTDNADVKYVEAVDVMTGIGAINGYTDGSIKPTATITREEAAKLVAYSILGADVAKNLATGATGFSDVDTGRWSAPFISYLVGKGIISGMGDGTFAPTANVTGYQFAKMMLCAAGYGEKGEYTGASWQLNVAVDANKYGVYDNAAGVDYTKAATREEAMLYAFNGIQVPQVTYNTVFGGYVAKGDVMGSATSGKTIAQEIYTKLTHTKAKTDGAIVLKDVTVGTVTTKATGFDDFGNPADVWKNNGKTVGAYAIDATASFNQFLNDADGKTAVAKALKGYTVSADVVVNGYNDGTTTLTTTDAIAAYTGNGTEVNCYANGTVIVRVVVVNETLAQVKYVDTANEKLTLSTVSSGTGTYSATVLSLTTETGYGKVAKDDYVVIVTKDTDGSGANAGDTEVLYVEKATVVKGKATSISLKYETVTVDGKTYKIGADVDKAFNLDTFGVTTKSDATLYVDENGYILKAIPGDTVLSDNLIAVTDYYVTSTSGKNVNMVEGYNSKGEKVQMAVESAATNDTLGKLYAATDTDGNDKYTLAEVIDTADWAQANTYKPEDATKNKTIPYAFRVSDIGSDSDGTKVITKASKLASIKYTDGTVKDLTYYYASDVKFLFIENPGATTAKVSVMSGVQDVTDKDVVYVLRAKGSTYEVSAVFVAGAPESSANTMSDLIFIAAHNGSTTGIDGKPYYGLLAVQNGALIENFYVASASAANTYAPVGYFVTATKNDTTGVYTCTPYPTFGGKTLNVKYASMVTAISDDGKVITATNLAGPTVIDASKAPVGNLDTGKQVDVSAIVASFDAYKNGASTKAPYVAVIFNENNVASLIYFFEK